MPRDLEWQLNVDSGRPVSASSRPGRERRSGLKAVAKLLRVAGGLCQKAHAIERARASTRQNGAKDERGHSSDNAITMCCVRAKARSAKPFEKLAEICTPHGANRLEATGEASGPRATRTSLM